MKKLLLVLAGISIVGCISPAQVAPPPSEATAIKSEAKPDYSQSIKVLFCNFSRTKGEWRMQLKNITKEPLTIDVVGISLKDGRGLEVGRAGVRNVIIKPNNTIFLKGKVNMAGTVDFSKASKAEVIFDPEHPDTYLK